MSQRRFRQTFSTGPVDFPMSSTSRGSLPVSSPGVTGYREVDYLAAFINFGVTGGAVGLTIDYVVLCSASPGVAATSRDQQQPVIQAGGAAAAVYRNGAANLIAPQDNLNLFWQVSNSGSDQNGLALQVTLQYLETNTPGAVFSTAAAGVPV